MQPVRLPSKAAAISVICATSSASKIMLTLPNASVCSAWGSAKNAAPEALNNVFAKQYRGAAGARPPVTISAPWLTSSSSAAPIAAMPLAPSSVPGVPFSNSPATSARNAPPRAELTRAQRARVVKLLGDRGQALFERARKHEDRVDARHLEVDWLAGAIGGGLELQPGVLAARESGRADRGVRDQAKSDLGRRAVQELHRRRRQAGRSHGLERDLGELQGGAGVPGVRLADDRISSRDRGHEIAARDGVERERKVVRAEHDDRPDRTVGRTEVGLGVDRGLAPGAIADRGGALAELVGGARKLDRAQARAWGQPRLLGGDVHQAVGLRLDPGRVVVQEARDAISRAGAQRPCGLFGGPASELDVVEARHRKAVEKRRLGRGIDGRERAAGILRGTPLPGDEDWLLRHERNYARPATAFSSIMPPIVMATTSPRSKEKSAGGTIPVPVSKKAPRGKSSSLPR